MFAGKIRLIQTRGAAQDRKAWLRTAPTHKLNPLPANLETCLCQIIKAQPARHERLELQ
jgi:hypothetical protein